MITFGHAAPMIDHAPWTTRFLTSALQRVKGGLSDFSSAWTMDPLIGFPENCDLSVAGQCAPTYEQLAAAGSLWPCPSARRSAASTWPDVCMAPMPIIGMDCPGMLTNATTCCCPKEYCFVEPRFNSIIAVCRGDSCACGGARANSCAPGVSAGKQTSGPWHLATPC